VAPRVGTFGTELTVRRIASGGNGMPATARLVEPTSWSAGTWGLRDPAHAVLSVLAPARPEGQACAGTSAPFDSLRYVYPAPHTYRHDECRFAIRVSTHATLARQFPVVGLGIGAAETTFSSPTSGTMRLVRRQRTFVVARVGRSPWVARLSGSRHRGARRYWDSGFTLDWTR